MISKYPKATSFEAFPTDWQKNLQINLYKFLEILLRICLALIKKKKTTLLTMEIGFVQKNTRSWHLKCPR